MKKDPEKLREKKYTNIPNSCLNNNRENLI